MYISQHFSSIDRMGAGERRERRGREGDKGRGENKKREGKRET